jgi:ubiquinone/menaquinone biosynthesis C-methylase UbiE
MSDEASGSAWLAAETARHYQNFTEKTNMYQELSQVAVDLAQLKPGQRVLDLGCGTGVTTQLVLSALGGGGHIFALDISGPMLAVAHQAIPDERVTFIHDTAENVCERISEPVDRVVCNSVFWQLRHKSAVMIALRKVLRPDGLFVFNAPEPYFIFQNIPRSSKVGTLFKQLIAERYGVGPQDLRTIEVFLNNHGFELLHTREFTRTRTAEESYLFFRLPVATAWMEPPLDYPTRMAVLEEAQQMAHPGKTVRQRWMYFVTRPVVS